MNKMISKLSKYLEKQKNNDNEQEQIPNEQSKKEQQKIENNEQRQQEIQEISEYINSSSYQQQMFRSMIVNQKQENQKKFHNKLQKRIQKVRQNVISSKARKKFLSSRLLQWKSQEEQKLIDLLQNQKMPMKEASKLMPGRTYQACRLHYRRILRPLDHCQATKQNQFDKRKWTAKEDLLLLEGIKRHKHNWKQIEIQSFDGIRSNRGLKGRYQALRTKNPDFEFI